MDQTVAAIAAQVSLAESINALASKALQSGTVVIDLGAGDGTWARAAMGALGDLTIHCFEPDPVKYDQLLINLSAQIASGRVIARHASVGWPNGWSGKEWASLRDYAAEAKLTRLPFVRLGAGAPITAVTQGCADLIRRGYIEFILAPATPAEESTLGILISPWRYEMFRHPALRDQVLCVSDRFRSTIKNQPPVTPSLIERCREFNIAPKGVIHVGAYEGEQARSYSSAGITKAILVEANPAVYERMQNNLAGLSGVVSVRCAATDRTGTVDLHVTSFDQSSSILPLARHREIYPAVQESSVVEVPAKTIDHIVEELGHNPADYDVLHLDIKGAELRALKGAVGVLPNVRAILTEVNFEELYAGCAMIEEMDAFLETQGFDRVATESPFHSSYGDAFYVRRRPAPVSQKAVADFLHNARNTLVGGWLNIPVVSLREAWEGATGRAHRHLIDNGIHQLPLRNDDDHRVLQLLQDSIESASKDRRLQLILALMLYKPISEIAIFAESSPGWLKKSLRGFDSEQPALAAA